MKFFLNILFAWVFTLFLGSAALAQDKADADMVLARVNGTDITLGHVIALVEGLPAQYKTVPADELLVNILNQLIQQSLLAQANTLNIKHRALIAANNTRAVLANAHLATLVNAGVDEVALQAAYDDYLKIVPPQPSFLASHILVETEDEAKTIVKQLDDGGDFAQLAKEKSIGPSGANGGDLGWFGLGRMVPEFEVAVMGLEIDGISAPVKTQFGWHVIKLFDMREFPPLEDLQETLVAQIRDKIIADEIARLELAGTVQREAIEFDAEVIRDTSLLDQ